MNISDDRPYHDNADLRARIAALEGELAEEKARREEAETDLPALRALMSELLPERHHGPFVIAWAIAAIRDRTARAEAAERRCADLAKEDKLWRMFAGFVLRHFDDPKLTNKERVSVVRHHPVLTRYDESSRTAARLVSEADSAASGGDHSS